MNNITKAPKDSWWGKKSKSEKVTFCIVSLLFVCGIVALVFVLFGKEILGHDLLGNDKGTAASIGEWLKDSIPLFFHSILSIVFALMGLSLLNIIAKLIGAKNKKAATAFSLIHSLLKWVIYIALVFRILTIWGVDVSAIVAGLGILGLVLGLAFNSLIKDIVAGLFIVFEDTYEVGDIVYIDDFRGTVKEIGLRSTKIEDAAGNLKLINNSSILEATNLTSDLSTAIFTINIDYREDLRRAEEILSKGLPEMKKKNPLIVEGPFYKGVDSWSDTGIVLKFVATCKEEDRFQVERDMKRDILYYIMNNNINVPCPVVHFTNEEPSLSLVDKAKEEKAKEMK